MLTAREKQVLDLLGQGLQAKEVGHALGISGRTVEKHACHIIEKLGARNMVHAVALWRDGG